jgi:hypothetical protein
MPSFIKEAHVFKDDETGNSKIELKYMRYMDGEGYVIRCALFEAEPIGKWEYYLSKSVSKRYEEFLLERVDKTIEVVREMNLIELENVLCENHDINSIIRIMNSIKVLDNTFYPPYINKSKRWQRNFVRAICESTLPYMISRCLNQTKLEALFNVLKQIEEEL